MSSERTPLLSEPPSPINNEHTTTGTVEEMPPPTYDQAIKSGGVPSVVCRVCKGNIDVEGRMHQHVVKCPSCAEATPIRAAPAGKKYVRCPCHCLLICKASSNRIACPRANCKRVITLGSSAVGTAIRAPPGTCRVNCAHCNEIFMFNTLNNALARCPHCRKLSSVGRQFARSRALIFLILGLISLVISVAVTVGLWNLATKGRKSGLFVLWAGVFLLTIVLLARFVYYTTMKTSNIEGPL